MEKHYADLKAKKFFPGLISYMVTGPVCAMGWEGDNAVLTGRKMLGATMPRDSEPGTIRGDLCIDVGRNICHGSEAVESANHEIALWFTESELNAWNHHSATWITNEHNRVQNFDSKNRKTHHDCLKPLDTELSNKWLIEDKQTVAFSVQQQFYSHFIFMGFLLKKK